MKEKAIYIHQRRTGKRMAEAVVLSYLKIEQFRGLPAMVKVCVVKLMMEKVPGVKV